MRGLKQIAEPAPYVSVDLRGEANLQDAVVSGLEKIFPLRNQGEDVKAGANLDQ
ncbi:MAG: hypothetical protein ABC596_07785 [Candidatus Methanosuratincola petrocarbonis]